MPCSTFKSLIIGVSPGLAASLKGIVDLRMSMHIHRRLFCFETVAEPVDLQYMGDAYINVFIALLMMWHHATVM